MLTRLTFLHTSGSPNAVLRQFAVSAPEHSFSRAQRIEERDMKLRSMQILTALTVVAGAARVATAAQPVSPWSLSISGGDSISESGSLRAPMSTTLGDLGALDPALTGEFGTLRLDRLRYDDLFRSRFDTGIELDYSFSDNLQTYGRFDYGSFDGRTRAIGSLSDTSFGSPAVIEGHFADADNVSLQFGSRYLWSTGSDWRPYAGFALGATYLDEMRASLTSTDFSATIPDFRFARAGTVFSQSLQTGVDYTPNTAFGLRFGIDADHLGKPPNGDDPRTSELGFGPSSEAHSSLWSFPVSIAANYRFGS
jgi:hypothetical protein